MGQHAVVEVVAGGAARVLEDHHERAIADGGEIGSRVEARVIAQDVALGQRVRLEVAAEARLEIGPLVHVGEQLLEVGDGAVAVDSQHRLAVGIEKQHGRRDADPELPCRLLLGEAQLVRERDLAVPAHVQGDGVEVRADETLVSALEALLHHAVAVGTALGVEKQEDVLAGRTRLGRVIREVEEARLEPRRVRGDDASDELTAGGALTPGGDAGAGNENGRDQR